MSVHHHPLPVYQFQPSPKNNDLNQLIPIPSLNHNHIPLHQLSLPPTPPRSVASSPPLSATDQTLFIKDGSLNSNGLPNRRHHYEMPNTPSAILPNRFPTIHCPSSLVNNLPNHLRSDPPYPSSSTHLPDPFRLPSASSWDGTLSAALLAWLALLRDLVAPSAPTASIHSANLPLPPAVRSLVAGQLFGLSTPAIRFVLLCALWYSASALSSNTGKSILTRFRYPVTLTIVQFGFVAAWSGLILALRARAPAARLTVPRGPAAGFRRPSKATMRGTCIMSLFSIAGHVFSSMAIARVPVSTVHTIKALSPLFTVAAYAGLFGVRYGPRTYVSLLPLTLGVMLACSFDMRANGVGFLCALGSTVVFVSQNIFGKKMLPRETSEGSGLGSGSSGTGGQGGMQMDKLTLLFYSSAVAFVLMVPIWAWTDAWPLVVAGPSVPVEGMGSLLVSFLCNGTVHFLQCILAFSILARTSPVTYSIASLVKRIAVICLAIVWFGQPVSASQACGMALTFGGLWVYNQAKPEIARGERRRGKVERRMEVLLPSTAADAQALGDDELEDANAPRRTSLPTHTSPSTIRSHMATQSNVTGNKTRHRAPSLSAGVVAPGHLVSKQSLQKPGKQSFKSVAVR